MRAGLLRDKITLERNFPTQGDYGEIVDDWQELAQTWAYIRATVGDEESVIYNIRIRYRDLFHTDRIVFGAKIFNILSVIDKDGMKRDLWLEARELV
jgi:head-tail adaptor